MPNTLTLQTGDALLVVDVQNDFLPGGALAVPHGDEVIPLLNQYLALFSARQLPIVATRDWHPANHCSFAAQGGPWPRHCVANTHGARFAESLTLPQTTIVISKATTAQAEAYSGFAGTDLAQRLRGMGVSRIFVVGLATDYCVLNTVLDGIKLGFQVHLLADAVRAVNVQADDGVRAEQSMVAAGAKAQRLADFGER